MLEVWVLCDFLGRVPPDPLSQAGQVSGPILWMENRRGRHHWRLAPSSGWQPKGSPQWARWACMMLSFLAEGSIPESLGVLGCWLKVDMGPWV